MQTNIYRQTENWQYLNLEHDRNTYVVLRWLSQGPNGANPTLGPNANVVRPSQLFENFRWAKATNKSTKIWTLSDLSDKGNWKSNTYKQTLHPLIFENALVSVLFGHPSGVFWPHCQIGVPAWARHPKIQVKTFGLQHIMVEQRLLRLDKGAWLKNCLLSL